MDLAMHHPLLARFQAAPSQLPTPIHLLVAGAVFAKPAHPPLTSTTIIDVLVPDLSPNSMFFWHRFVLIASEHQIFSWLGCSAGLQQA